MNIKIRLKPSLGLDQYTVGNGIRKDWERGALVGIAQEGTANPVGVILTEHNEFDTIQLYKIEAISPEE